MTRYARLFSDGSMSLMPTGTDPIEARRELIEGHEDDDVELLEVDITMVRSLGKPKLQAVKGKHVMCPTCGEDIWVEIEQCGPVEKD